MAIATVDRPFTRRVSWGALFAGMFVGLAVWLMLMALGAGIGLAAFDPTDGGALKGLGIGVGIWGAIAAILSFFFAGWLSARLSSSVTRSDGAMHGVALWGLLLVFALWLTMMAVAGATATGAGLAGAAASALPQQREQVQQQAQRRANRAQDDVRRGQANDDAAAAGETAKKASTGAAWGFFVYSLLTLVAAALGGRLGVPGDEHLPMVREERVPLPPGAPTPQHA